MLAELNKCSTSYWFRGEICSIEQLSVEVSLTPASSVDLLCDLVQASCLVLFICNAMLGLHFHLMEGKIRTFLRSDE